MLKGKRVLVAGGSGFIGTNLALRLVGLGANVRVSHHKRHLHHKLSELDVIHADFRKARDCERATDGMDYVFMLAAATSGAGVMAGNPLAHLTPNVVMNSQMLEAAYKNNVKKYCFISSNTVYPDVDYAVKESDAAYEFFEKYHVVGWMKRFSEEMCIMYRDHVDPPMECLIVRPGNLYGPYDKFTWAESKVIAALVRRAVEKQDPFVVWGDGMDLKDFLYIDDFIDALLGVFTSKSVTNPINIASGKPVTIREIVSKILYIAKHDTVNVSYDASKPTMIPKRLIDISAVTSEIDWRPITTLDVGLKKTVDWYRKTFEQRTPEDLMRDNL